MGNILEDVQIYIADKLNSDSELSGLCPFVVENKRDIDYEIKAALGKQGLVGLVMTPKATYIGAFQDYSISWQIDEVEIDIIENVTVNRGKRDGYVTGQDASMRLFNVLCPLSGDNEGQFNPVSYEEGEDNSLLVNKCLLKCLVHEVPIPAKTIVQFADGTSSTYDIKGQLEMDWLGSGVLPGDVVDVQIGEEVTGLGEKSFTGFGQLSSIVVPKNVTSIGMEAFSWTGLKNVVIENGVTELGYGTFSYSNGLSSLTLPSTLTKIGADVFEECGSLSSVTIPECVDDISQVAFRYSRLSAVAMEGKTKNEVLSGTNYPWGLGVGCQVTCSDGTIVVGDETVITLSDGSKKRAIVGSTLGNGWENYFLADRTQITEVVVGHTVTRISSGAFTNFTALKKLTVPSTVTNIEMYSFYVPSLDLVIMEGKTIQQVKSMSYYHWSYHSGGVIRCTDGDITL